LLIFSVIIKMATSIVDGMIVRRKNVDISPQQFSTGGTVSFSGRARSLCTPAAPPNSPVIPITHVENKKVNHSSANPPPRRISQEPSVVPQQTEPLRQEFSSANPPPKRTGKTERKQPKVREPEKSEGVIDLTKGVASMQIFRPLPALPPYEDFHIPCEKSTNRAAIIFFPNDSDPAFSFADKDFIQRIHYMSKEFNIFGKRALCLQQATDVAVELRKHFGMMHMELGGHGTPTSIDWPGENICVGEKDLELSILLSTLEPGSTVLTLSCQNGKSIPDGENMLEYLARIGYGHKIIGTSCDNGKHLSLKVSCPYPLELEYSYKGRNVTIVHQLF
jgi:hypothetical protein